MNPHMTIPDARKKGRLHIGLGKFYRFYSDCVECKTENGNLIRAYSGQEVEVLEETTMSDAAAVNQMRTYKVRANNGDTFTANQDELNGWNFDIGQWVGPRVN